MGKGNTITINNPNRANKDSTYPSNTNDHDKSSGNYSGGNSFGGNKNTGYSQQEQHIINTVKALGNSVLGASTHDSRKDKSQDGYNASLKLVVDSIKHHGYGGKKGLLLSDCDLTAHDMNYLSATMPSNSYNFTLVDFSYNPQIGPLGVDYLLKGAPGILSLQSGNQNINLMYKGMLARPNFNIVKLDLSNCNIGDIGADILGHALSSGKLPATKYINLTDNNITKACDAKIVYALNNPKTPDVVIVTRKLQQNLKMITGTKEEKIAIFKDLLKQGADVGVNNNAIVADGSLKSKVQVSLKQIFGFSKCHWNPEGVVKGYAQDKIFAKLPKALGKFVGNTLNVKSIVSCYLEASNDAWTSDIGQAVLKDQLCVMGETEFCNDQ